MLSGMAFLSISLSSFSANPSGLPSVGESPMEMDLESNIHTPSVPAKLRDAVRTNVRVNIEHLRKHGLEAQKMRDGEAIIVVIPCEKLFAANAVELLPGAQKLLTPFESYLRAPSALYKLLVAVHSDNTGSKEYADELTESRVAAIDDFLTENAGSSRNALLIPYAMGMDDPVADNSSRIGRQTNRRVEFYLIPTEALFNTIK